MSKIHDWTRLYWRNADGSREHNPEDVEVEPEVLSLHQNARGEQVGYREIPAEVEEPEDSDEDAESEADDSDEDVTRRPEGYEVTFNGELVEDVTLEGENFDGEEFEALTFDTRRAVREAASDFMRMLAPIDPEKLDDEEEDSYDYDELQALAKPRGISANQGADELRQALAE